MQVALRETEEAKRLAERAVLDCAQAHRNLEKSQAALAAANQAVRHAQRNTGAGGGA